MKPTNAIIAGDSMTPTLIFHHASFVQGIQAAHMSFLSTLPCKTQILSFVFTARTSNFMTVLAPICIPMPDCHAHFVIVPLPRLPIDRIFGPICCPELTPCSYCNEAIVPISTMP
jgi:hypothetical protein